MLANLRVAAGGKKIYDAAGLERIKTELHRRLTAKDTSEVLRAEC
jgi:hypothetical protein